MNNIPYGVLCTRITGGVTAGHDNPIFAATEQYVRTGAFLQVQLSFARTKYAACACYKNRCEDCCHPKHRFQANQPLLAA